MLGRDEILQQVSSIVDYTLRASDETKKKGGGKLRCQKITMAKDDELIKT